MLSHKGPKSIYSSWKKIGISAELVMPSGETLTLLNRMESGRNEFKETFSTETDENLRPAISKEMKGIWTLRIADFAEKHEGTLDN